MSEIKALFPIGKTQWRKWNDKQKTAFNEAREAGVPFADAVEASNQMKKSGLLEALKDVVEVAETAAPLIAVAKTVAKATKKKAK